VREATKAFGVPSIELSGYEADDLIAAYSLQGRATPAARWSSSPPTRT
jgi:5'-3' exonuclease